MSRLPLTPSNNNRYAPYLPPALRYSPQSASHPPSSRPSATISRRRMNESEDLGGLSVQSDFSALHEPEVWLSPNRGQKVRRVYLSQNPQDRDAVLSDQEFASRGPVWAAEVGFTGSVAAPTRRIVWTYWGRDGEPSGETTMGESDVGATAPTSATTMDTPEIDSKTMMMKMQEQLSTLQDQLSAQHSKSATYEARLTEVESEQRAIKRNQEVLLEGTYMSTIRTIQQACILSSSSTIGRQSCPITRITTPTFPIPPPRFGTSPILTWPFVCTGSNFGGGTNALWKGHPSRNLTLLRSDYIRELLEILIEREGGCEDLTKRKDA